MEAILFKVQYVKRLFFGLRAAFIFLVWIVPIPEVALDAETQQPRSPQNLGARTNVDSTVNPHRSSNTGAVGLFNTPTRFHEISPAILNDVIWWQRLKRVE